MIYIPKSKKLNQTKICRVVQVVYKMSLFWFLVFSAHLAIASSLVEFEGMYLNLLEVSFF